MKKNKAISLKDLIIIVIVTSLFTSLTTGVIMYNNNKITNHISGNDLSNDENLKEFLKVYASLVGDYYTDIDKKEMLEQAISAMFQYLGEDYSDYLSKDESSALAEKLAGEYQGIGIQIMEGGIVYKVFDDSPASKAGLVAGDVIKTVNQESVEGKSTSEIAKMIQSVGEGNVLLTVSREEEILTFEVSVETLMVPAISYQIVPDYSKKIGYLAISTFSDTVATQVKKALASLENDGMESLIIDLRGNSGGYLSGATDIASMFLEKDKVIFSLAEKNETKEYKDETDEKKDYPLIILMDGGTASASEVLAAALKDSYGATLLGTISFGKGKVQQTRNLEDGSMVKYTTARWLRPNGECIDGIGLKPDIEVTFDENNNGEEFVDVQLKEALRILDER